MVKTPLKTIEHAYAVWRSNCQNVAETYRVLKDEGYDISRKVIFDWRAKYHWEQRAARSEAEEKERRNASKDEVLLSCLVSEKQRLEAYLNSLPQGDVGVQATREYNKTLKDIVEVRDRIHQKETAGDINLTDPASVVKNLWGAIAQKLAAMQNYEHCTADNIKDINESMEVIEKIMKKFTVDGGEQKEYTPETIQRIKQQVYGL